MTLPPAADALPRGEPAACFVPGERRGAWYYAKFWWHNFLGCWPLVLLMFTGIVVGGPAMLVSPEGAGKRVAWGIVQAWARWLLRGFGVRVWVRGADNVRLDRSYVVAINHRSHLDVPVVASVIPLYLVAIYKRSLDFVPLLGQVLRISGSIAVDRRDRPGSRRQLDLVADRLARGRSIVFFPEGTRSAGPGLSPFKRGAAVVALEQQCAILPITVLGTGAVYPPGRLMVHQGDVVIFIHPPIETTGMALDGRDALLARLQQAIAEPFTAGPVTTEQLRGATRVV